MAAGKPTILLVPGAWHQPKLYEPLSKELERLGYTCITIATFTVGKDSHGKTWVDDVVAIMAIAQPLFDEGKEVVVVGHSYGGLPTAAATKDQTIDERAARGEIGGFKQLVLLCAYLIPEHGKDLRSLGERYPDFTEWQPEYTKNGLICVNDKAKNILYNDLPADHAQELYGQLVPHSQDAMETPVTFIASDVTIPKAYVFCTEDLAIPLFFQEALVATAPGFKPYKLGSGHSPFASRPKECAELLVRIVEEE